MREGRENVPLFVFHFLNNVTFSTFLPIYLVDFIIMSIFANQNQLT